MKPPPQEAFQQYVEAYQRRAAARAAVAHHFINAVAGARLLEDMEVLSEEQQSDARFGSVGRFVQRVLANLPMPQPHQPVSSRAVTGTFVEGEVIPRSSASASGSERTSGTGGTQPPIVIVIDRDERPKANGITDPRALQPNTVLVITPLFERSDQ